MKELLLELFSEEVPSYAQKQAAQKYEEIFTTKFAKHNFAYKKLYIYYSTRRLTIHVVNLVKIVTQKKNHLQEKNSTLTKQGTNYSINKEENPVIRTEELKSIIKESISSYIWPKSMKWNNYNLKWIRPLKNILCIFDGKILKFNYEHLESNNITWGHRTLSSSTLYIESFDDYKVALENNYVILDQAEKKRIVEKDLLDAAKKLNLEVEIDDKLLDEVLGRVEFPVVLTGKIEKTFLSLPKELIISCMRKHQKYFSLRTKDRRFASYFLFIINIKSDNYQEIIEQNENILSARLNDAMFFYKKDLGKSLESLLRDLNRIIFHEKLGNLEQKTNRIVSIVKMLTDILLPSNTQIAEIAKFCKIDLISETVNEFPNLQGVMGYYFLLHHKIHENFAQILKYHYKPEGPKDKIPPKEASLISIADKMDTICGLLIGGEKLTSSKDPYGIRRSTLGIIRTILHHNFQLNLEKLIEISILEYSKSTKFSFEEVKGSILFFFTERVRAFFRNKYGSKLVKFLFLEDFRDLNICNIAYKLSFLESFLDTETGKKTTSLYKRISNLALLEKGISSELQLSKKFLNGDYCETFSRNLESCIDESLLESNYEIILHKNLKAISSKIVYKNYRSNLILLRSISRDISNFLDHVTIQTPNKSLFQNREKILLLIMNTFYSIFNFKKLI